MKIRARYTLQQRIATLMIIFSLIFISAFCAIQVKNQMTAVNNFNLYRARLSALVVKNNLERVLGDHDAAIAAEPVPAFAGALASLKKNAIIEEATIFTTKCEIVTSLETSGEDRKIKPADYRIIEEYASAPRNDSWFIPNIDQARGVIDLYIPLLKSAQALYIAKLSFSLGNIEGALKQVYIPIIVTVLLTIVATIILGTILTRTIVTPINILNNATKAIAAGDLHRKVDIQTRDEIEELGGTFNLMTDSLQKMKERAENANPLTKLPGNNVIHEEITKRIVSQRKFLVIYSDLDNFKAFNDKYGIGAGDKAIKMTADIMSESLKLGGNDAFIGHEGGDDFVLITTPAHMEAVTSYILKEFDKRVRGLFKKEDLDQGFIIAHARDGSIQKFPLMTISLAGVSNELRTLSSYGEITNICAEVKKKAKIKITPGSTFVLDKRTS